MITLEEFLRLDAEAFANSGLTLLPMILTGANLSGNDLSGANLNGADLTGANLSEADLSKANSGQPSSPKTQPTPTNYDKAGITVTLPRYS